MATWDPVLLAACKIVDALSRERWLTNRVLITDVGEWRRQLSFHARSITCLHMKVLLKFSSADYLEMWCDSLVHETLNERHRSSFVPLLWWILAIYEITASQQTKTWKGVSLQYSVLEYSHQNSKMPCTRTLPTEKKIGMTISSVKMMNDAAICQWCDWWSSLPLLSDKFVEAFITFSPGASFVHTGLIIGNVRIWVGRWRQMLNEASNEANTGTLVRVLFLLRPCACIHQSCGLSTALSALAVIMGIRIIYRRAIRKRTKKSLLGVVTRTPFQAANLRR